MTSIPIQTFVFVDNDPSKTGPKQTSNVVRAHAMRNVHVKRRIREDVFSRGSHPKLLRPRESDEVEGNEEADGEFENIKVGYTCIEMSSGYVITKFKFLAGCCCKIESHICAICYNNSWSRKGEPFHHSNNRKRPPCTIY
jgi:hypothetical protein